jgi:hypothetical protein
MATPAVEATGFSAVPIGAFDRVLDRLRLPPGALRTIALRAAAPAALVWLPLVIVDLLVARSPDPAAISFYEDLSVHVRFLIVVPLLVFAELDIRRQTLLAAAGFALKGVVAPEDRARFEKAVAEGRRWSASPIAEGLLVVAAAALMASLARAAPADAIPYWFEVGPPGAARLTPAGWWYMAGSTLPLFLILRWGWRYGVWCRFLFRMARMSLRLTPTHPDKAGGLGFVGIGHTPFALIGAAVSCLLTATVGTRILHLGAKFESFQIELAAIVAIVTVIGLAPMLLFTPALASVRRRGLLRHGEFSNRFVRDVEGRMWNAAEGGGAEVTGDDIQSLADLGTSYERVQEMRLVPVDLTDAAVFALAAGLPMLVLILANVPFESVMKLLLSAVG